MDKLFNIKVVTVVIAMAISGSVMADQPVMQPSCKVMKVTSPNQKCHVLKIPRPKVILSPELALSNSYDIYEFDDDGSDEITIQSITELREVKKKVLAPSNDDVAERLSMIKWIVLAKIANPNFHKT